MASSPIALRAGDKASFADAGSTSKSRASGGAGTGPGGMLAWEVKALEQEKRRMEDDLAATQDRKKALDDAAHELRALHKERMTAIGSYDRFFGKKEDASHHPLGRANAVKQTKDILARQRKEGENARARAFSKYNAAVAGNDEVRRRIDLLRRQQIVFTELFVKMEAELQDSKRQIATDQDVIDSLYDARDTAQLDMVDMHQEMAQNKMEIQAEWDVLTEIIDAANAKISRRRSRASAHGGGGVSSSSDSKTGEAEASRGAANNKRGAAVSASAAAGGSSASTSSPMSFKKNKASRLAFLKDQLALVRSTTGHSTTASLVEALREAEDQKYSKVTATSELVTEVADLEKRLRSLQTDFKADRVERQEHKAKRGAAHDDIETALQSTRRQATDVQHATSQLIGAFEGLLMPVHSVWIKVGGEKLFAMAGSGGSGDTGNKGKTTLPSMFNTSKVHQSMRGGISTHNVTQFVGVIEQRAAEIMQQYAALFPGGRRTDTTSRLGMTQSTSGSPTSRARSPGGGMFTAAPPSSPPGFPDAEAIELPPGTFGPSEPPGRLKMLVQTSAIRAAILDNDKDEADEPDMPLSKQEMRLRAVTQLSKTSSQVARTAAAAAVQHLADMQPATGGGGGGGKRK